MKAKLMISVLISLFISSLSIMAVTAVGPPLKENACASRRNENY